jgi:hypothetical protein
MHFLSSDDIGIKILLLACIYVVENNINPWQRTGIQLVLQ